MMFLRNPSTFEQVMKQLRVLRDQVNLANEQMNE